MEEFLKEVTEILEHDEQVQLDTLLNANGEWDSLAIISVIAAADQILGVTLKGDRLFNCSTVGDIVSLIDA